MQLSTNTLTKRSPSTPAGSRPRLTRSVRGSTPVGGREHRGRRRQLAVVGERDQRDDAELTRPGGGRALKPHPRRGRGGDDLHVAEAPPGQGERLGHRLLGAEASGEMGARAATGAGVVPFGRGEQAVREAGGGGERPLRANRGGGGGAHP